MGFTLTSAFVFTAVIIAVSIPGKLLEAWVVERWGRRPVIIFFGAWRLRISACSNSAKAPSTDSSKVAIGACSSLKANCSVTNGTVMPRLVSSRDRWRRSSRSRGSRSVECTTTVSPARANFNIAVSSGRLVLLPETVSVNTVSTSMPSSCRSGFCPTELTRT